MSNFKLLAIRPLRGCGKRFTKNLTPGQLYRLYNSYNFYNFDDAIISRPSDEKVGSVVRDINFPIGIYDRSTADDHQLKISISAIAGKNGSGKSSLIELFFACVYLYAVNHEILKPNISSLKLDSSNLEEENFSFTEQQKKIGAKRKQIIKYLNAKDTKIDVERFESLKLQMAEYLKQEDRLEKRKAFIAGEKKLNAAKEREIISFGKDLRAEVFFELDQRFYCLSLKFDKEKGIPVSEINTVPERGVKGYNRYAATFDAESLTKHFFYTIGVNYSHYALNSIYLGEWINSLFHKNDGYKTPIVISPMRTGGNFNINSEMNFARYRLLVNKLQAYIHDSKDESKIYITENHFISRVVFSLNRSKVNELPKRIRFRQRGVVGTPRDQNLLSTFLADYLDSNEQIALYTVSFPLKEIISNYIVNKIESIPEKYPWFGKGYQFGENTPFVENDKLFQLLKEDRSHVTYKLKQAVNFLKYNLRSDAKEFQVKKGQLENNTNIRFDFSLGGLMNWMKGPSGRDIMALLPPSIFEIDFELSNDAGSKSFFNGLSSGEQQLVHTIQSVIYHLNNLQSAHLGKGTRSKYEAVNIVYDEIELYFHPDYQRRFIADLLKEFERFYLGGKSGIRSVNILLLTHSPFILSDIPLENILLLELDEKTKRSVPKIPASQTFAANINDLLADGFFLTGTLMGEFAETEIKQAISLIKENDASDESLKVLDMVGDSFLRASLKNFQNRQKKDKKND